MLKISIDGRFELNCSKKMHNPLEKPGQNLIDRRSQKQAIESIQVERSESQA